jgi:hypothetical protein
MHRITFLSLALVIGLCLQAPSVFGQDQDQKRKDTKEAKGANHGGKGTPQASKQSQKGARQFETSRSDKSSTVSKSSGRGVANRSRNAAKQNGSATNQGRQQTSRRSIQRSQNQSASYSVQGNRGNQYNGQWSEASVHSDWSRHGEHEWNHHHYGWYDGGWLIIDAGPSPAYYQSGSLESRVQERLSEQGYYNGPIDGDIGPGSRHAIANYQADQGLRVDGRIDDPTLASLRLE